MSTLINLPPPQSGTATPSDAGPSTPNSTTTSLSALSTTAIKDGHQGHLPHSHHQHTSSGGSASTLAAERADRISRLAGLERVAADRQAGQSPHMQGYFPDQQLKERSTVGSASATGSVGGRTTTWASGSTSDMYDDGERDAKSSTADYDRDTRMSDVHSEGTGMDEDRSSVGGFSDEGNASLVGFGEGAGSVVSGPTSSSGAGRVSGTRSGVGSPTLKEKAPPVLPGYFGAGGVPREGDSPASAATTNTTASVAGERSDARMIDGMTYDPDVVDTTVNPPHRNASSTGVETAERIMREQGSEPDGNSRAMGSPEEQTAGGKNLGKFYFEDR